MDVHIFLPLPQIRINTAYHDQESLTDSIIREKLNEFRVKHNDTATQIICNENTFKQIVRIYTTAYRIREDHLESYFVYGMKVRITTDMKDGEIKLY